jgi:beta-1,4-N-acetylglucosaminyltransferase
MIFLTVGTQFAFDRLVKAVDKAVGQGVVDEDVYAQIGRTSYKPRHFEYTDSLGKELFDDYVQKASHIISHAGMGTIIMALDNNKPLLVMPRLSRYGEVVNNHQVSIAKRFERDGCLLAAYDADRLSEKMRALKSFTPCGRQPETANVINRISVFLAEVESSKNSKVKS